MVTVDYILQNGGATINRKNDAVMLKTGYQVSVRELGRCTIKELTQQLINDIVEYALQARGEYAGFWIENGWVYCDISIRVDTKAKALQLGKELKQISIFNWRKTNCIYC